MSGDVRRRVAILERRGGQSEPPVADIVDVGELSALAERVAIDIERCKVSGEASAAAYAWRSLAEVIEAVQGERLEAASEQA